MMMMMMCVCVCECVCVCVCVRGSMRDDMCVSGEGCTYVQCVVLGGVQVPTSKLVTQAGNPGAVRSSAAIWKVKSPAARQHQTV